MKAMPYHCTFSFIIFKIPVALIAGILWISSAGGQQPAFSFDHFTVENGLSQNGVLSIAQDKTGFMWFGTRDGLNKFDGVNFRVYRNSPSSPALLTSHYEVNALFCDSKGRMWAGTENGVNLYRPDADSFIHYLHNPFRRNGIGGSTIRCIYEDREGVMWFGTDSGLNRMAVPGRFEHYNMIAVRGQVYGNNRIKAICQDSQGYIWVGTGKGLFRMYFSNGRYQVKSYLSVKNDPASLPDNDITTIAEDRNHNIWIGTHLGGIALLDKAKGTFRSFASNGTANSLGSNVVRKIIVHRDGNLWIATLKGISIYNTVTRSFQNLKYDPADPAGLNQNSIYNLFQDSAGSVWAGTYFGGINVAYANTTRFRLFKSSSVTNSISGNIIRPIAEDGEGNIWIGTEGEGLNRYNRKTGSFTSFKHIANDQRTLSSNLVKALAVGKNGDIWVGTHEGGIDLYNPSVGIFKHYPLASFNVMPFVVASVSCLLFDSQQRLWAGIVGQGLFTYDKSSGSFISVNGNNGSDQSIAMNVKYLFEDRQGNLWIVAEEGLFCRRNGQSSFIQFTRKDYPKLVSENINCVQQDASGNIWLGTYDAGLLKYEPASRHFTAFGIKEGLPGNNIAGILEDEEGYLWLSTAQGLCRFNVKTANTYTTLDGLPGNTFNYNSFFRDSKGIMYFGGYNGLVSFYPGEIQKNNISPRIVFTGLRLLNEPVSIQDDTKLLTKNIHLTDEINFRYNQNIFTIDFAALNYIKSRKNRYAYKLEGAEREWNYSSRHSATYTNLPPGDYVLLVKAANNDGVWNHEAARMLLIIHPPFWRTWWAYSLYTLLLAGLLYYLFQFILMRASLKRELELDKLKLEFFTYVSHEIRTPLTLIVGPLEELVRYTQGNVFLHQKLMLVKNNAGRMDRLVNELLDFRKVESGKMNLRVSGSNIDSFLQDIYLSFQHLANGRGIDYRLICREENIHLFFDKVQMEKVIYNLLSNAFKAVPDKGYVYMAVERKGPGKVRISVTDNGKGIPEEYRSKLFTDFSQVEDGKNRDQGTGIGLALAKKIVQLHHGEICLETTPAANGQPGNTCFSVYLDTGNEHFESTEIHTGSPDTPDETLETTPAEVNPDELVISEEAGVLSESKPLVLVAEDNPELRSFIVQSLRPFYLVMEARNGLEAWELAIEHIPDLMISDVMMPEMDGLELCRLIKADDRTSHVPFVMLTARAGFVHEVDGLTTGADLYLTKPFSPRILQLNIANLLALREKMRLKFSRQLMLEPSGISLESSEEDFVQKLLKIIETHLNHPEFGVHELAAQVYMSTPILYKKVKALTGMSVNNFIKSIRLKKAAQLLSRKNLTVSEVAFEVGFNDTRYFSQEFRKQFGQVPSAYKG